MRGAGVYICLIALVSASAAMAGTVNLSTGYDSTGALITTDLGCDANWVETAGPTPACTPMAQIVMPEDLDWWGGWTGDGADPSAGGLASDWITSDASSTANGSPLPTYSISFYLADVTGASLSGYWYADDGGTIALNGNVLGSQGSCCTYAAPVSASATSDFVAGINTLTLSLNSSDDYLDGVRFAGSVTGDGASLVPEPASGLMLLAGSALLVLWRRRQAKV